MNLEYLLEFGPILLALFATLFTWGVTAAGSALVFTFKTINRRILNLMRGFAADVMIAASFWSLLSPAIEMEEAKNPGLGWAPGWIFIRRVRQFPFL